jgi:hypothetical protein
MPVDTGHPALVVRDRDATVTEVPAKTAICDADPVPALVSRN